MTASVPWSVSAVDPEAWATARDAARRSGVSVGEWLEGAIRDSAHERGRPPHAPVRPATDGIEQRLDELAERLDQFARKTRAPEPPPTRGVRHEQALFDSIETLSGRIDMLARDMRAGGRDDPVEVRTAIQRLDERIEDLLSRGKAAGAAAASDVEDKLDDISRTIEAMSRRLEQENARYAASAAPQSIDALDAVVAEIMMRQSALDGTPPPREAPRPATAPAVDLSGLETQLKHMADEMRAMRRSGVHAEAIDGLRREIGALAGKFGDLAPRRSLESLEAAVDSLAQRIEGTGGRRTEETLDEVAEALRDIRAELADVLPSRSVASVVQNLHDLSSRLDSRGFDAGALTRLQAQTAEIRDLLASALPSEVLQALVDQIEMLVRKVEKGIPEPDGAVADAIAAFDRRLTTLSERVEAATRQGTTLPALDDIRARLDDLHAALAKADRGAGPSIEASLRALAQKIDAAEARLGNLGTIERGLRDLSAQFQESRSAAARPSFREVAAVAALELERPTAARYELRPMQSSEAVDDLPLEPGSGAPRMRAQGAGSRAGQEPAPDDAGAASRTSDFIAAARRAAQAAASEPVTVRPSIDREAAPRANIVSMFGGARRALLIALCAFLLIFAALRFLSPGLPDFLGTKTGGPISLAPAPIGEPAPPTAAQVEAATPPADQAALPITGDDSMAAAPPAGVIGSRRGLPFLAEAVADPATTGTTAAKPATPVQTASTPVGTDANPVDTGGLPDTLGSAAIRAAAAAGDPIAAYEIGARYLEGRGPKADPAEAAKWFERALANGSAPAGYRLGSLYEKGQGVPKNQTEAMRYYTIAAEGGNIKAMHNLAVMYAEGAPGKPDYKTAARWFRLAADRGVRDSQYNLGVIYARGLGVEQNLTESFRWFALAANQGDTDAEKKRDDIGKRLDVQTLVAAKLAVQTWTIAPVDAAANEVRLKPEWDRAEAPQRRRSVKKINP